VKERKLPIRYGPFTILDKSGTNYFRLDISPYMQIYLVVNVENLKIFEPPMIMDQDEEVSIPLDDELVLHLFHHLSEQNRGAYKLSWVC
jgi:hypothetical protein